MKTLDEVIEILERQIDKTRVKILDKDLLDSVPDALHYLKKYRDNYEALSYQVERYQKAQQCEEVLKDYIALKQIALRQYCVEAQDNPPLTWDELRQMEGKPVWIEGPFITEGPHWIIVGPSHLYDGKIVGYGKTWQAYRKEKE